MDHPNISQGQHIYFRCMAPTTMIYGKCYIWFIIMKSCGHTPFLQKYMHYTQTFHKPSGGKNIRNAACYRQSCKDGNQHDLFHCICTLIISPISNWSVYWSGWISLSSCADWIWLSLPLQHSITCTVLTTSWKWKFCHHFLGLVNPNWNSFIFLWNTN